MKKTYNYQRTYRSNSIPGNIIDLGSAGSFSKIIGREITPPEECIISGTVFSSVHTINSASNKRIFTAFRSEQKPSILYIEWRDYPFYPHIEEGGDFMLQVMATDSRVKHLIIDNTYVRSGWMNSKMDDYLNNGWLPGLVELELVAFCHLQAESFLGERSFEMFVELLTKNINVIAESLGRKAFRYFPVKSPEINENGLVDENRRLMIVQQAFDIISSLK